MQMPAKIEVDEASHSDRFGRFIAQPPTKIKNAQNLISYIKSMRVRKSCANAHAYPGA